MLQAAGAADVLTLNDTADGLGGLDLDDPFQEQMLHANEPILADARMLRRLRRQVSCVDAMASL